ncbi:hypothetical protein BDZ89DRAFT_1135158 [Hymenopellis radicata]|nr:hypothetical protein BDZ89DRAFT_1135158 [Hymenopellis radicata]
MARTNPISSPKQKHRRARSVADTKAKPKPKSDHKNVPGVACLHAPCSKQFLNKTSMKMHFRNHLAPQNPGFNKRKKEDPQAALSDYRFPCGICTVALPRLAKSKEDIRKHYSNMHDWVSAENVEDYIAWLESPPSPSPPPRPSAPALVESLGRDKSALVQCACGEFSAAWNKTMIEKHVGEHLKLDMHPEVDKRPGPALFVFVLEEKVQVIQGQKPPVRRVEITTFDKLMKGNPPLLLSFHKIK